MTYFVQASKLNGMKLMFFPPAWQKSIDLQDAHDLDQILETTHTDKISALMRDCIDTLTHTDKISALMRDCIDTLTHTDKISALMRAHTDKISALMRDCIDTLMQEELTRKQLINAITHNYTSVRVEDNIHQPESHNADETTVKVGGETFLFSPIFEHIKGLEKIKTKGPKTRKDDNKIFDSKDVDRVNQTCLYELESILLSHSKVDRITDDNYPLIAMELRIFYSLYDLFMKENHDSQILKSRIAQIENIQDSTVPKDRLINLYNIVIEQIETQASTDEKNSSSLALLKTMSVLFKKPAKPKLREIELTSIKKTYNSTSTPIR